jgi:hypothetical protein
MGPVAIGFGVALVVLGLAGYFGTDRVSPTALIPAAFGLALVLLGLLALKETLRKHAMHLAAMVALLGVVGGLVRLIQKGLDLDRPASLCTLIMTLLCAGFVGLCVRSFILARRNRTAALPHPTGDDVTAR